ncbi:MAG TPA: hypothetical protein DCS87_11725 [Rheinheimera sp.]|nr:hypothetical protein [Rheinheimera sp.]
MAPEIIDGHGLLCGQTVPVKLKDGSINVQFVGFIDYADLGLSYLRVKIEDIMAYSPDGLISTNSVGYCRATKVLGAYCPQRQVAFIVLRDNWPIAWCDLK